MSTVLEREIQRILNHSDEKKNEITDLPDAAFHFFVCAFIKVVNIHSLKSQFILQSFHLTKTNLSSPP